MANFLPSHAGVLPDDILQEYPGHACLLGNLLEVAGVVLSDPSSTYHTVSLMKFVPFKTLNRSFIVKVNCLDLYICELFFIKFLQAKSCGYLGSGIQHDEGESWYNIWVTRDPIT